MQDGFLAVPRAFGGQQTSCAGRPARAQEQAQQPSQTDQDGLVGLMIELYDRLFDSQNN